MGLSRRISSIEKCWNLLWSLGMQAYPPSSIHLPTWFYNFIDSIYQNYLAGRWLQLSSLKITLVYLPLARIWWDLKIIRCWRILMRTYYFLISSQVHWWCYKEVIENFLHKIYTHKNYVEINIPYLNEIFFFLGNFSNTMLSFHSF